MKHQPCLLCLLAILFTASVATAQTGENIALGKKYTSSPAPNYSDTVDLGDAAQLTDGKITSGNFWMQQGTVGWQEMPYVAITIDLERVEPIGGVSFRTAAGAADVTWPKAIHVLTSDDGKNYRDSGDLVVLDLKVQGPWPNGYAVRKLATSELRTRGRFIRFVVLLQYRYIFCDEIEIFRGSPDLLQGEPGGTLVTDVEQLLSRWRFQASVQRRFEADIYTVGKAIDTVTLTDPTVREALRTEWTKASAALRASEIPDEATFRAVLPYNEAHTRLFQVQAALWKAQGRAKLTCGVASTWDPVDLVAEPPLGGQIDVHTMRGEYRAAAVNLANTTTEPIEVRLYFDGLPGSPAPEYVTVHEVPWTDTAEGVAVAAALPLARRDGPEWRVTVLPGLVQQVWFTFHVQKLSPGEYKGNLVVESPDNKPMQTPVGLRVYPLDFPQQTTLQQGGFDYTDGEGRYGVTPQNRKAFLSHLQDHFVNAPWADERVMLSYRFDADGTIKLDTQAMDDWLLQWPNARTYHVGLLCGDYNNVFKDKESFGGAKFGTVEFDQKVGTWISAWVRHLGSKGISPDRLAIHLYDELHEGCDLGPFLAWTKAIRAAEPKVTMWSDPCYYNPAKAPSAFFDACDILCPCRPMWLISDESFGQFYRDQQHKGRRLNLTSPAGPARLLDPYSQYRLQAWHCSQIGATGSFFWAFGDNSKTSSWNEYPAAAGPFTPLFLDDTTVTAGKHMEAIREGIEDYEYFVLLRNAVDKAKVAGRSDSVLSEAESLLATGADEVLTAPGASELRWHTPKDRTKADAVRIRILEVLSQMQSEQ